MDDEERRARHRAADKRYRERDPEKKRALALARQKRYRERNLEKVLERERAYREQNREEIRERERDLRRKRYVPRTPEQMQQRREYEQKRRLVPGVIEKQRAYNQKRYSANRDAYLAAMMFNAHGLRPEDWAALWNAQDGRCYLCGEQLVDRDRQVHVDHDHSCCPRDHSCQICRRGLACADCNLAIGHLREDAPRLRRMADALEAAQAAVESRKASMNEQLILDIG